MKTMTHIALPVMGLVKGCMTVQPVTNAREQDMSQEKKNMTTMTNQMNHQEIMDIAQQVYGSVEWNHHSLAKMKRFANACYDLGAKKKVDQIVTELQKQPLNDTANSIALWVKNV